MRDLIDKASLALWSVWRFRWTALLLAWVLAIAGWSAVMMLDYRYRAGARLFVDTNRVLEPLLRGITVLPDVRQQVSMMSRALLTRPNLEELARMTDLDLTVTSPAAQEKMLERLRSRVTLKSGRIQESIYTLAVEDEDPGMALRLVQSLITIFIENQLGDEREDSRSAQSFLDAQIADYEQRLRDAEARLSAFKRENAGSMPGESGGYYSRYENTLALQRNAEQQLREARNRRDELIRQLDAERARSAVAINGNVEQSRINALQDELDELLVRFTERHPRVSQLRETIASLQAREPATSNNSTAASRASRLQESIVYQNIRTLLTESQASVAELEARVNDYARQAVDLEKVIDTIPEVEARLEQLDRDYETVRTQHAILLERRETAKLSKSVGQDVDDVKFRIIDPPYVSTKPIAPNKLLFNAGVLALAIGAGIALSLLLSMIRPVFFTQRELTLASQAPVLGSVSMVTMPMSRFSRLTGTVSYSALVALLLGVFSVLTVMELKGIDMPELIEKIDQRIVARIQDHALIQKAMDSGIAIQLSEMLEDGE